MNGVGPNCEAWPNNSTESPYYSPKIGPQFGLTLYNFRFELWRGHATAPCTERHASPWVGEASDPAVCLRSRTLDVKRYSMHTGQSDSRARSTQTCRRGGVREATV